MPKSFRNMGGGGGSTDWDDITGKPSTFPPTTPVDVATVARHVAQVTLEGADTEGESVTYIDGQQGNGAAVGGPIWLRIAPSGGGPSGTDPAPLVNALVVSGEGNVSLPFNLSVDGTITNSGLPSSHNGFAYGAVGAGAGTGGNGYVLGVDDNTAGSDTAGRIQITFGSDATSAAFNSVVFALSYSSGYSRTPLVQITGQDGYSGNIFNLGLKIVNESTTGFEIRVDEASALPNGSQIKLLYRIIEIPAAPVPTITSVSANPAFLGVAFQINGTNLQNTQFVQLDSQAADSVVFVNSTQLTVQFDQALDGTLIVQNVQGFDGTLADMIVQGVPTIDSFLPAGVGTGTNVVISGTNFLGATSVSCDGVEASSIIVNNSVQITAQWDTSTEGTIIIATPAGTVESEDTLTVT